MTNDETIESLKAAKDAAYAERNKLVCALSRVIVGIAEQAPGRGYDTWLGLHPAEDSAWEKDWMNIVFMQVLTGQLSWHIHDSELPMFGFLAKRRGPSYPAYDGHTTEQKYDRLLWWRP